MPIVPVTAIPYAAARLPAVRKTSVIVTQPRNIAQLMAGM